MATHNASRRFGRHPILGHIHLWTIFGLFLLIPGILLSQQPPEVDAQFAEGLLDTPLTVSPQEGPPGTAFTFSATANMFELSTGFAGPVLHIWEPGEYDQANLQEPAALTNRITIRGREDTSDELMSRLNMTRTLPTYAGAPCGEYTAAIHGGNRWMWSAPTTFTISCEGAAPAVEEPIIETAPGNIEIDLGDGLMLRSERMMGEYSNPRYRLEMHTPVLVGDPARTEAFNQLLADLIEQRLDQYRAGFLPETCAMNTCAIEVDVEVTNSEEGILGLLFTMYVNFGGAHPNLYHMTLNYDLVANQQLALSDMFQEANYLDTLYGSALNELLQLDYFDDPDRVTGYIEPVAENYANWAVTPDGLIIVFDTFPHVIAALKRVFIPAADLADIVNPDSPVAVIWGIAPTEPTPMPVLPTGIPDGLVYSAGGQQYVVDLNTDSSTSIGVAPPENSILGPGDSRLWMEMLGDVGFSANDWEAFQIVQSRRDGSDQQVLLDSETFFEQFGQFLEEPFSDYSKYVIRQELVVSQDATQVFFSVCTPSQNSEWCNFFQLDFATRNVSEVGGFTGPGWLRPDRQRAIDLSDLGCFGSLQVNGDTTPLSGTPVSLVWLPDDRFIFSRHICKGIWTPEDVETQYDIILANADGSDDQVLVPGMIASDMALAPDQQTLAFITTDPSEVALWLVNLDGSDLRKVMDLPENAIDLRWHGDAATQEEPAPAEPLAPAPTDGEIAYVQDGNIYLLDLTSGETTPLVEDGTVGSPGMYGGIQLAWSPDGQRLAFSSNRAGDYDIYMLDVASGEVEPISTDPLDEYLPTFSPDGTVFFVRIIDIYEMGGIGEYALVQYNLSGQQIPVYTIGCDLRRISARTSTQFALTFGCSLVLNDGSLLNLTTSTEESGVIFERMCGGMKGYTASDSQWSHNGATLAVIGADCPEGDTSGNWRNALFLVDPDNLDTEPERILGDQAWFTSLDWAPNDEWLVYAQRISFDEPDGLWLVSAQGGEPIQVSRDGNSPAWRPVAMEEGGEAPAETDEITPDGETAESYILSGRVTDVGGNPAEGVLIAGDTCGSTTTDADGNYDLIWSATESPTCEVRPYEQTVTNNAWGAAFDPPVYTFSSQSAAEQHFVMHSERRPLIFIPGIMGSMLHEMTNPPSERWPGFGMGGRDRLILGNSDLIATDAIRRYTARLVGNPVTEEDIYGTLLETLLAGGGGGYSESRMLLYPSTSLEQCEESGIHDANLFVFAYDWRKSNDGNADILRDYIECVREQTGSEYVDVVAHSMGGVLTRRYVLENQNNHYIDRFISVATPWLGAPRAIVVIETGQYPGITPVVISPVQLKPLAEHYPGAHELLPNETYFTRSDEAFGYRSSAFWENGWDYNQNGNNQEFYTYEGFVSAFDQRFDSNPATANRTFYSTEQSDLSEWHGVEHYNFYGHMHTHDTIAQVFTGSIVLCSKLGEFFVLGGRDDAELICENNNSDYFWLSHSSGDGTVPVISAVPPPLEEPAHCSGYQGGNIACFSGDKEHVDHGALVRNADVLTAIVDVLARRTPAPSVAQGGTLSNDSELDYSASFSPEAQQADANTAQPAHYITILNTPSATLADSLGNTTDAISGTLSIPVPNASYYILGENAHMFVMPASETYTVTLPVGEAPMALELRTGTGDTSTQAIRYRDQTFPISTTAMLEISPQGVENLRYDSDGDGTFDTSVEPTVLVSGENANDTEPPTVSIAIDEQDGLWLATITAEDDNSGVKQVLYSTDDQQYVIYEGPFEVNPDEVTTLYAFVDDNVANRSSVAVYDLAQDQQFNWSVWIVVSGAVVMLIALGAFLSFKHMRHSKTRVRPRR